MTCGKIRFQPLIGANKSMLELLLSLSFLPILVFAIIAILNTFTFPRLRRTAALISPPLVSVLVPMRNEAAVITETVRSLLAQDYPDFEILLLDDQSVDDSVALALSASAGDPRLQILTGTPLPAAWLGKPWACHQLAQQARGELLLFTDADVHWELGALKAIVAEAQRTKSDLLTVWPQQETVTWGERLIVPLMGFSILAYLPALAVHHIPWPVFAAAIGQCLLFKREAYAKIGGHAAIKDKITDDMAFAYAIKGHGLCFRMADSAGLLTCRMYRAWDEVRNGYAKNILAGHGNSLAFLAYSTVFHWWLFMIPWLWLIFTIATLSIFPFHTPLPHPVLAPTLVITIGIVLRALTAAFTHQRLRDALLMPVSVFLMTLIAIQGVRWHFNGGPEWKGRQLNARAE
jgi:chlorobactene glucosyltransferase